MQRIRIGARPSSKANLRIGVLFIILFSAVWLGGCGATSKSSTASSTVNSSSSPLAALAVSPTSVNFGSVTVGNATAQLITLTNASAANVTISSIAASAGFGTTAGSNITLMPNQSVNVYVSYQANAPGTATGTLTVASTAANSLLQVGLSGQGTSVPAGQHSVSLGWSPDTSAVAGYNVYRGLNSGGPYGKINNYLDPDPNFYDDGVSAGEMYYYVVTSVDSSNVESGFSNQVVVSVP